MIARAPRLASASSTGMVEELVGTSIATIGLSGRARGFVRRSVRSISSTFRSMTYTCAPISIGWGVVWRLTKKKGMGFVITASITP